MYRSVAALAIGGMCLHLLAACGTTLPVMDYAHPEGPSYDAFLKSIVAHVRCELQTAVRLNYDPKIPSRAILKNWAAKIALTVKAADKSTAAPGIAVFNLPGTFNFSATGSFEADGTRETVMTYFLLFDELIDSPYGSGVDPRTGQCELGQIEPISGNLGIEQTLQSSLKSWDSMYTLSDRVKGGPFDTITHHVTFAVTGGGSLTPTWKFTNVSANTAGSFLGGSRTRTDDLLITMGPTQLGSRKEGSVLRRIPSPALDESFQIDRLRNAIYGRN